MTVCLFPPNRLGMYILWDHSGKQAPPLSKRLRRERAKTWSCHTRGWGEDGRVGWRWWFPGQVCPRTKKGGQAGQEERGDPSGRESRVRERRASPGRRAEKEGRPLGRQVQAEAGLQKQAQTSPGRAEKRPRRPKPSRGVRAEGGPPARPAWPLQFLPPPSIAPDVQKRPSPSRRQTHAKGPKVEFSREHNLPPTPHTTRLTVSRDLKSGSAQGSRLPSRGIRGTVHKFSCAPDQSFCQFNR